MSEKTSNALHKVIGPEAEGTAELFSMVDKFFDCLNVHNLTEAKVKINHLDLPIEVEIESKLPYSRFFKTICTVSGSKNHS